MKKPFMFKLFKIDRVTILGISLGIILSMPMINLQLESRKAHIDYQHFVERHTPYSLNFTSIDYSTSLSLNLGDQTINKNILFSKFDVNQDGKEEIFTYNTNNPNTLKIWAKDVENNEHTSLCIINSYGQDLQLGFIEEIAISKTSNKGFKDIILYHPDHSSTVLEWNGKCYQSN